MARASSNAALLAVPARVSVKNNDTSANFSIATSNVTAPTSVTVTASFGGVVQRTTVIVAPANTVTLASFTITPARIVGGNSSTGMVTLSGPAPAGGALVHGKKDKSTEIDLSYNGVTVTATITIAPQSSASTTPRLAVQCASVAVGPCLTAHSLDVVALTTAFEKSYNVYSPELSLFAETIASSAASPSIAYEYVWFAGQPLVQVENSTGVIHWYFNDHLGTPILQTDVNARVFWQPEYEPYGTAFAFRHGEAKHQPLRFPGQQSDASSDLTYNVYRWYNSGWGRYTQADPIGLRGGMNLFRYAGDNPVRFSDPTGLVCGIDVWTEDVTYGKNVGFKQSYKATCGHQWITWPGGSAGFWPNPTPTSPFQNVPGWAQIPDPKTKPTKTHVDYTKSDTYFDVFKPCPKCDATVRCVSNAARQLQQNPPSYCLAGYNCYSFVAEVLNQCGLTLTSTFEQLESQK